MIARTLRISLVSIAAAAVARSQSAVSQPYLDAYAEWRKADPALERDAGTAGAQAADRVIKAYSAVSKYTVARNAYVRSLADDSGQLLLWIQNSATGGEIDLAPVKLEQALVSSAMDAVNRGINTYSKDTDRGIIQLRQALERERAALAELNQAITDRDNAWSKAQVQLQPAEDARGRAMTQYQALSTGYSNAAAETERESPLWAAYYQALSDDFSRPPVPAAVPAVTGDAAANPEKPAPITIAGVRIMNPANPDLARTQPAPAPPETPRDAPAAAPPPTAAPPPAPPPSTAATPAVSLNRYVGEWTYPLTNAMFFGPQPEAVEMAVTEESGHLTGTLTARFKTAGELKLTLSGDLRASRTQSLAAESQDGGKGTLELIPGSAYNLLEVNYRGDGALKSANFVLVKK